MIQMYHFVCILILFVSYTSAQPNGECKETYLAYQNSARAACPPLNQINDRYCGNPTLLWQNNRLPSSLAKLLGPDLYGPNWQWKGVQSREQYDRCIAAYTQFDATINQLLSHAQTCKLAGTTYYSKCPGNVESSPRVVDVVVNEIARCTSLLTLSQDTRKKQCADFFATQPLKPSGPTGVMNANGIPQQRINGFRSQPPQQQSSGGQTRSGLGGQGGGFRGGNRLRGGGYSMGP